MEVTANDLCDRLGIDYAVATALIKLMLMTDQAEELGKRPSRTGKGKPSTVYTLKTQVFVLPLDAKIVAKTV